MRARRVTLLSSLAGVLLLGLVAAAQEPKQRMYDPATVETIEGTVEEVKLMAFGRSRMGGGVHLLVNTGRETVEVHLGPRFYLEDNDFEIEPGDSVQVAGSRVAMPGRPALMARKIQAGDYSLELRNEDGTPRWAGRGGQGRGMGKGMRGGGCPCCAQHCCGRRR